MILIDANLLLYAVDERNPHHEASREWLDGRLNGTARVGLPWPSLLAFVRIISNPRIYEHPITVRQAWSQAQEWLDCPSVWIPLPTDRHAEVLGELLGDHVERSELVPDAHLAALAIEHGLVLCSTDRDFARFPGLRWLNPLAERP